jgi:hypothetical protein
MIRSGRLITGAAVVGGLGMFLSGAALMITAVQGPADDRPIEQRGKFGTSVITVDVGTLPNPDCWVEVGVRDTDGRKGGDKIIETETLCP